MLQQRLDRQIDSFIHSDVIIQSSIKCCLLYVRDKRLKQTKQDVLYQSLQLSTNFRKSYYLYTLFEWMHRPTASRVVCMICVAHIIPEFIASSLSYCISSFVCLIDRQIDRYIRQSNISRPKISPLLLHSLRIYPRIRCIRMYIYWSR